jgi:hypothetical protein
MDDIPKFPFPFADIEVGFAVNNQTSDDSDHGPIFNGGILFVLVLDLIYWICGVILFIFVRKWSMNEAPAVVGVAGLNPAKGGFRLFQKLFYRQVSNDFRID